MEECLHQGSLGEFSWRSDAAIVLRARDSWCGKGCWRCSLKSICLQEKIVLDSFWEGTLDQCLHFCEVLLAAVTSLFLFLGLFAFSLKVGGGIGDLQRRTFFESMNNKLVRRGRLVLGVPFPWC